MRIARVGNYRFSIISDDGSKLWIDNRYTINNDGLHGWRNREANRRLGSGWHLVRLEMFEKGGHAGMMFRYRGPDTGNRWTVARARGPSRPILLVIVMLSSGKMCSTLAKVAGART